jgi:nucleotide-binding universal stress UspA family protein
LNLAATQDRSDSIKRILVGVDSTPASVQAVQYLRQLVPVDATVRLVSIVENPRRLIPSHPLVGIDLNALREELRQEAQRALTRAQLAWGADHTVVESNVIELSTADGDIARALVEAAHDWSADLLVVGARHHHGLLRWVEGTVSEPVAHGTSCATLIVPECYEPPATDGPRRVLFALDGSAHSLHALQYGLQMVGPKSTVRAIYVVDRAVRLTDFVPIHVLEQAFIDEGNAALGSAAELFAGIPQDAETSLISTTKASDDVPHTIVREAVRWRADLLVVGTHGRRGVARWLLGSVAGRVARCTKTPLLLVPAHAP